MGMLQRKYDGEIGEIGARIWNRRIQQNAICPL